MNADAEASKHEVEDNRRRERLTVKGVVQGVGFRPFVYGLAREGNLGGFVGNDSRGVFIEVEGPAAALDAFREALTASPPPLAAIESVAREHIAITGEDTFRIVHSEARASENTLVSPDICICDDCYKELFDPANRRFAYPFINCTNCGPRFSIIKDIPYDRPLTTMAEFEMCAACQAEYDDPLDRRFHAQPNACAQCGPHVWLELPGERPSEKSALDEAGSRTAIWRAKRLLAEGKVVAVKGLGGFHLACDATNDNALRQLRERKGRVDKPFAVMAADLASVHDFAYVSAEEETYLLSRERPIVLLRKKPQSQLSPLVSPGNLFVGVMLPYTPLHYMLLQRFGEPEKPDVPLEKMGYEDGGSLEAGGTLSVLVMTSGNYSDEPIVKDNEEARQRLGNLADAFLFHNREIHARCDDSVIRVLRDLPATVEGSEKKGQGVAEKNGRLLPIRRSRGYAPFPVRLPYEVRPTLAVGGELKATFCLAKGAYGFMSQHIGDMENLETLEAFEAAVAHFEHIFRTQPGQIACDLHPRYLSSRWAVEERTGLPVTQVQHHHAHIASVMAEHQVDGATPVIGVSFDGTGYGRDGAIWGGEILVADYAHYERYSHLAYVPLVGGDQAIKRPYRVALGHLSASGIAWDKRIPSVAFCPAEELGVVKQQLEKGLNVVPTSSMGRLFDAVASISGVRQTVSYEAQAAIEFEAMTSPGEHGAYAFDLRDGSFSATPIMEAVVDDVLSGVGPGVIAARFHGAVANLIVRLCNELRVEEGLTAVALSGGVFQNSTLLTMTVQGLYEAGFTVYYHRLVPPNDGGLALGQAMVANA